MPSFIFKMKYKIKKEEKMRDIHNWNIIQNFTTIIIGGLLIFLFLMIYGIKISKILEVGINSIYVNMLIIFSICFYLGLSFLAGYIAHIYWISKDEK